MFIEADVMSPTQSLAKISHKGETITFTISLYQKKSFQEDHDVFEQLNKYWADLSEAYQDEIFQIYKDFDVIFNSFADRDEVRESLMTKAQELMSYHTLAMVDEWVNYKSNIVIPRHIKATYSEDINSNTTRDKTYVRQDYRELVVMSLALRCMIPIWGQEVHRIRKEVGNRFKESRAFDLLSGTEIVICPAFRKLSLYVEGIIERDKENTAMILEGIPPENYGEWVVAMICVLRLTIGDIRGTDTEERDMCKYIYKFITQKVRNNDSNNEQGVRDKERERQGTGEDKSSNFEWYKQTTDITVGEEAELQIPLEDPLSVALSLQPDIDMALVHKCLETAQLLRGVRIMQPQIDLFCWVIKQITTPYVCDHIEEETMVDLIGVTQAVLWHRGHKYLSLLVSSHPVNDNSLQLVGPGESRMRVTKDLLEQIDKYYPYSRSVYTKRLAYRDLTVEDQDAKRPETAMVNAAVEAIDTMAANLSYYSWRPTASEDMLKEVMKTTVRRLPIRPDIKIDLATLVVEIGSRSYLKHRK